MLKQFFKEKTNFRKILAALQKCIFDNIMEMFPILFLTRNYDLTVFAVSFIKHSIHSYVYCIIFRNGMS